MDVALYLRLSLDRNGTGAGVDRQEAECRAYAAERGWTVSAVYVDNDLSATSGRRRPAFEDLLNDAPAAVLVWHTDRLVRVSRDLERVLDRLTVVHAVTAGQLDLSTPTGRAMARTLTAWATFEGEHKAERQRAEAFQRAQAGRPNWPRRPFGYELDGSLRAAEADAIRDAYASVLAGVSRHEIARRWNAQGLVGPLKGQPWTPAGVRFILQSPRNAGLREYRGRIVGDGTWTPVVDRETWEGVLAVLQRAKSVRQGTGREVVSLLSGIATCTNGHAIVGGYKTAAGTLTYRCTGGCCSNVPREAVDAYVWALAVSQLLPAHREAWKGETSNDAARDALNARHAIIRGKLTKAAEMWTQDLITDDQLKATTADLKAEEVSLKAELAALVDTVHPVVDLKSASGEDFAYMSPQAAAYPPSGLTLAQCRETLRDLARVTIAPRGKGTRRAYDPAEQVTITDRLTPVDTLSESA